MDPAALKGPVPRTLGLALLGGLAHGLAMPGSGFPGAALLVVAGIALFAELALRAPRPLLACWLFGATHYAWSSASLRHPLLPGYVLIALVGALYFLLMGLVLRRLARGRGEGRALLALPLLWSLYETLKAQIPELPYPHAQSAHALYRWPELLGPVAFGGEALANTLVAALGAALWALARGRARLGTGLGLGTAGLWGALILLAPNPAAEGPTRHVALVQSMRPTYPDQPGGDVLFDASLRIEARIDWLMRRYGQLMPRILAEGEPELVVWPESCFPMQLDVRRLDAWARALARLLPAGRRRLIGVVSGYVREGERDENGYEIFDDRVTALYLGANGEILGRHEKRLLVPGGERVPILPQLLPAGWVEALQDVIGAALGGRPPNVLPGLEQDAMTLDGTRFGVAICFENAFPQPFAAAALEGAGFFVVLSHEGWYRGGSELEQLVAASVFRALETGRPVLRATTDGITAHVDAAGRIVAMLPKSEAGVLHAHVRAHHGERMAMRWGLRLPWLFLGAVVLLALLRNRRAAQLPAESSGVDSSRPTEARLS